LAGLLKSSQIAAHKKSIASVDFSEHDRNEIPALSLAAGRRSFSSIFVIAIEDRNFPSKPGKIFKGGTFA